MRDGSCRCGEVATVVAPAVAVKPGQLLCAWCALEDAEFWIRTARTREEYDEVWAA